MPHGDDRSMTLTWHDDELLGSDERARLLGPGSQYELTDASVFGTTVAVFVRRPRHFGQVLAKAARRFSDRDFLIPSDEPGARITWSEAPRLIAHVADLLHTRYGIRKGDRVAIASANSVGFVLSEWAAISLGAVVTNLNGWWTGPELDYGIGITEPAVVLADPPRHRRLRESGASAPLVELVTLLRESEESGADAPVFADADEDDPALILFTSGTTGKPKGATLTHRNLLHAGLVGVLGRAVLATVGQRPNTPPGAALCSLPFFHISGTASMLHAGPMSGATLLLPPPGRFDPGAFLRLTEEYRLTNWSGVGAQYWRVLEHPDFNNADLSSVRNITSGGGPFPPALMRELREGIPGVNLSNGYGATELTGGATGISGKVLLEHPESVGRAHPTVALQIRRPDGSVLGENQVGEICVRGATVFQGYWKDDGATKAAFHPDRWYRTGDFGRIVAGLLYLDSRRTDLIVRGGENVYPAEIEYRLVEHPEIADAAVVGIADPQLGQVPAAYVVLHEGSKLTPSDVTRWAAGGLSHFKVPVRVDLVGSLPYTETGKLRRNQLGAGEHAPPGTA